jgi:hypothetical protein
MNHPVHAIVRMFGAVALAGFLMLMAALIAAMDAPLLMPINMVAAVQ